MQRPAQLKITTRFGAERKMSLSKSVFTIGRKAENDLQLLHDTVSRQHAEIQFDGESYFIVDVGSKRGTFVNGQRVQRIALQHLDRILIGSDEDQQLQFLDESVSSASAIFDSHSHLNLTQALSDRMRLASANEELQKLSRFVEVNQAFKFSMTPDDVLCLIVDAAIEITQVDRGFLMLKNNEGNLEFKVARDKDRNWLVGNEFEMSRSVVEEAFKQNKSIVVNNQAEDIRESVRDLDLRSIACIPLRSFQMTENMDTTTVFKRDVIGVLYVDSHVLRGALTETSLRLLESLAFEATKSLESVRLMHEEQEKKNIEIELGTARQVQVALSPTIFKHPPFFEVAAASIPSRHLGGDFYDLLAREDGSSVFVLGDVSGKGIPAALLAAMAQGALQAQLLGGQQCLEVVITSLNRVLVHKSASGRFLTLFCASLKEDGTFDYVNAGHNLPVLIRRDGSVEYLTTKSILLGAFDFATYKQMSTTLEPGDVVVMYTDGVTEAVNSANDMFGDERLEELLVRIRGKSAEQIQSSILDEVVAFTGDLPQGDDITLVTIKMKGV
jgi:sigma-B regulation protein RsbU (phosphoserine phosphatase)